MTVQGFIKKINDTGLCNQNYVVFKDRFPAFENNFFFCLRETETP